MCLCWWSENSCLSIHYISNKEASVFSKSTSSARNKVVNSSPSSRIQQLWIPWSPSSSIPIMNSTLENYFPVEESTLITILAFLGLILAPVTIFCNILVIIPFCRCSRVRSASNQILLALAITDCILGFLLFLVSITGLTKITRVDEPNAYCHINYAVAMGMTTLQVRYMMRMYFMWLQCCFS